MYQRDLSGIDSSFSLLGESSRVNKYDRPMLSLDKGDFLSLQS